MSGRRKATTLQRLAGAVERLARRWRAYDANERAWARERARAQREGLLGDVEDHQGRSERAHKLAMVALAVVSLAVAVVLAWQAWS